MGSVWLETIREVLRGSVRETLGRSFERDYGAGVLGWRYGHGIVTLELLNTTA